MRLLQSLSMMMLAIVASAAAAESGTGRQIAPGLYQMTGTHLRPGQTEHRIAELPDPAPPYVTLDGKVEIYGSAPYFIRYPNWQEFDRGGTFEIIPLDLRYPSGIRMSGEYAHPWDIRKYRVESPDQSPYEILVGGSMSPTQGRSVAVWPEDNINRRIFAFRQRSSDGAWVRDSQPIVGTVSQNWNFHSYGGNYFQVDNLNPAVLEAGASAGQTYFFYERVSDTTGNRPFKTEIFAQPMVAPFRTGRGVRTRELPLIGVGDPPYPATRRTVGGYLVEGPRPVQVDIQGQTFFLVGFSGGDFCTDDYAINFAWSRDVEGPYQPLKNDRGDLLDLGAQLKRNYGLSWVGRPALFRTAHGSYEMMFHGVLKSVLPDNDYAHCPDGTRYQLWQFFRMIFKANVRLELDASGTPRIVMPE